MGDPNENPWVWPDKPAVDRGEDQWRQEFMGEWVVDHPVFTRPEIDRLLLADQVDDREALVLAGLHFDRPGELPTHTSVTLARVLELRRFLAEPTPDPGEPQK